MRHLMTGFNLVTLAMAAGFSEVGSTPASPAEGSPSAPQANSSASVVGSRSVRADFNGDGFADLAVGAHGERSGRGAVNVVYGSARGLSAAANQYWTQDSRGIRDKAENGDHFGWALAAGSLDGDIYAELAVGVYGENAGRGAVNVPVGSPRRGLAAAGNQRWTQDSPGIKGRAELGDYFGLALPSGP